jgi:hypothetical protein
MLLSLQTTVGNAATARLMKSQTGPTLSVQRGKKYQPAIPLSGGRPPGISAKLARARWSMKKRYGHTFQTWKRGYEAQHVIPYSVANKLRMKMQHINESWNGMMLPSGRARAAMPLYKAMGKYRNLPRHIAPRQFGHPKYSNQVLLFAQAYIETIPGGKWTLNRMILVANYLRRVTKGMRGTHNIDQLKLDMDDAKNLR